MELLLFLVVNLVDLFISFVLLSMLVRSVLSMFMVDEDSKIFTFVYAVTEPFVLPLRNLFYKKGWFQSIPIDAAFFITFLLLIIIQTVLSYIPIGI